LGVSLRAQGRDAELRFLDAWQMKGIYDGMSIRDLLAQCPLFISLPVIPLPLALRP
jgi:hypothetical protein